jgi:hypothetical protein
MGSLRLKGVKMKLNLTSLADPVWSNENHTAINCVVTFAEYGETSMPFTADKDDCEVHGVDIFNRLVAGEFGDIGAYVPLIPAPTKSLGTNKVTVL